MDIYRVAKIFFAVNLEKVILTVLIYIIFTYVSYKYFPWEPYISYIGDAPLREGCPAISFGFPVESFAMSCSRIIRFDFGVVAINLIFAYLISCFIASFIMLLRIGGKSHRETK